MPKSKRPTPAMRPAPATRAALSEHIRHEAAHLAKSRPQPRHETNGETDEALARAAIAPNSWIAAHTTFTKGLSHDSFGRVQGKDLIVAAGQTRACDASPSPNSTKHGGTNASVDVPYYTGAHKRPACPQNGARRWESPTAGEGFDLQGSDADVFDLPPAPMLGSDELIAEMAELYGAALLRDVPFDAWDEAAQPIVEAIARLPFFAHPQDGQAARRHDGRGALTSRAFLAGSTAGAKTGPYVSQFLLVGSREREVPGAYGRDCGATGSAALHGTASDAAPLAARFIAAQTGQAYGVSSPALPSDGFIRYGVQSIDQRFTGHLEGFDHLTEWAGWLDVQNGADRKNHFDRFQPHARFAATPRDLASYVHYDMPEQAYRNAALLLLGAGQPMDIGLPEGPDSTTRDAGSVFGGAQILALISEVAARAQKAASRQKFQHHLRARPEAVAAGIALAAQGGDAAASLGAQRPAFERMASQLEGIGLLAKIRDLNATRNATIWDKQYAHTGGVDLGHLTDDTNVLLPQAYPEGAPMHPSYGAAHAAVAGACVTVLKACFEMFELPQSVTRGTVDLYTVLTEHSGYPTIFPPELFGPARKINGVALETMLPDVYAPDPATAFTTLKPVDTGALSVQGELDKLASNMAMGRSFAGVNTSSDHHEALRLGERVAIALLQERMLTLCEPLSMRLQSFDADLIMIAGTSGTRAQHDALVLVWDQAGRGGTPAASDRWWQQETPPAVAPQKPAAPLWDTALRDQPRSQTATDTVDALLKLVEYPEEM